MCSYVIHCMVKSIYYGRHARHLKISYEREEKERERERDCHLLSLYSIIATGKKYKYNT
jgi:hypothetical protein